MERHHARHHGRGQGPGWRISHRRLPGDRRGGPRRWCREATDPPSAAIRSPRPSPTPCSTSCWKRVSSNRSAQRPTGSGVGVEEVIARHPASPRSRARAWLHAGHQESCAGDPDIVAAMNRRHVLTVPAGDNMVRFLPPLVATDEDVDVALEALDPGRRASLRHEIRCAISSTSRNSGRLNCAPCSRAPMTSSGAGARERPAAAARRHGSCHHLREAVPPARGCPSDVAMRPARRPCHQPGAGRHAALAAASRSPTRRGCSRATSTPS